MSKTPAVKPAITLCALRAGELVRVAGELPDRLLVAPWGTHAIGARGQAIVAEATAKVFADNMVALKRADHVCLDFNHNSLPGHASYLAEQEPRKIAATGKPEMVPSKGVFLTGLTWTPEGKAAGLRLDSVIDCTVIATIPKTLVVNKIGAFPQEVMEKVDQCLMIAMAIGRPVGQPGPQP